MPDSTCLLTIGKAPAAGRTAERSSRRQQLFVQVEPDGSDAWRLDPIVDAVKAGAVGIIPTDSNPAFVCDLGNRAAVEKLLEIKRARANTKMSILCRSMQDVDMYTLGWPPSRSPGQPDMFKLVKRVLPGPYTFILPASKELPKAVTNLDKGKSKKRSEVGVRLPDDPVAQALLAQLDRPLLCSTVSSADGASDDGAYAPDAATLMDRYGNAGLDFVVDAGPRLAEGSTVIDCTGAEPEVTPANGTGTLTNAAERGAALASSSYTAVKSRLPPSVLPRVEAVEEKAAPVLAKAHGTGATLLKAADERVDAAVSGAQRAYAANAAYLQEQLARQKEFHAQNLTTYREAREAYLKKVEDAVESLRQKGLAGSARAAADAVLERVGEAKAAVMATPGAVLHKVHQSVEALLALGPVHSVVESAKPALESARGQYLRLHDSLVATPQYRQAWRTAVSLATTVQQIPLVTAVQARLEPLAKPYVDTVAASPAFNSATQEDICAFFEGYPTRAVYIGLRNGKPTGEAYVEFEEPEEAARALKERQHEHIGSRYIELFVAGEADLLAQTCGAAGGLPTLAGHVVRLRGLPFASTAADVVAFFEGVDTVGGEAGVVFTCTPDGRPTGEAYVELAGPEALAGALARHKEKMGARYIEIFESSKGDMFQAVQQHGFFTGVGGRRRHHWHQAHAPGGGGGGGHGAATAQYAADVGSGGGHGRGSQMDEMMGAFAGFGLSQRDMQVPGPPRWGAYGAPADQAYPYGGMPPRQMQQAGMMQPGAMRWRPSAQMQQTGMQHFNPAPGPPPGKGPRSSMPNGTRGGGMLGMHGHEYGGAHGHGGGHAAPTMMFNPFMMQHPLMVHPQQQHHGSAWGTAGMMQQQGGWYGGMQMGRSMQMGGMGTAYAFQPSYYPVAGRAPAPSSGGHHQQHNWRQQSQAGAGASSYAGGGNRSSAAAAPPPAAPPPVAPDASSSNGEPATPPQAAHEPAAEEQPGSAAAVPAAAAAPPAMPEQ
ncbi:translation factor-like [Micractinium conductrix]|uniref:Threonylcarbamoyl-AMP synthase n=1 Tax=Micractinium conductrix TaxID=554055 RepID=A0A2P6VFQ3_9CHLO|nr:translation factor-like [Micractinium conductrix]|eukprot:PSC72926.1 translation factor-like [Micractinium conductrix]